ncbi:hydroxymethylglutaryl-CoA synthase [Lactobacillus pasteurii DSM 23907 = CRBIP 24.76]|uniref:Possible hydroxymethylglutaryl-CoA synthase n=1 Tax=Lactobacillus pasteurii DSM 23907 = CRBIP 24.76 TaxID=1423790 RepID=I7J0Z0_9LACO|nr:hydroxymethylglutaryl-CoA synthase [Lactobacillus pasteurii]KRK08851.1 hydroxymethylglutaryl-CoA synthase [Lactobacillus pasteurii DSM 23907 = CRBIP 24.76]TDG76314.1 hypothetical protein C5L33_001073 [Lactobacillus pasteurii]CCI85962.1 Possible hydroxymethylglutaryl-CoA synthase [Lactobacillus pasteurii DSM 23907 = CRBIP 24.76]
MKIGIDKIGFYTPNKYIDMVELAHARNVDPNKFLIGIGQKKMAVADVSQDAVSMGINATLEYFNEIEQKKVGLLIFATESSVDQSKSASLFVKKALNLHPAVRTFEIKEACFGLTAALMTARDYVRSHPHHSAIVIGSDIARYGLNTPGEVTQGAGSISMLIKADPRILTINEGHSAYSDDINDFWRPNGFKTALVEGKYSTQVYLDFFKHTFESYKKEKNWSTQDFSALIYHLPFTKQGLKANRLAIQDEDKSVQDELSASFEASKQLSMEVGNIYTASLYLSLLSLLEHAELAPNSLIGLFSYGSGAMAEFFSGNLVDGYRKQLALEHEEEMFKRRQALSIDEYEKIFTQALNEPEDGVEITSDEVPGTWYFAGTQNYVRQYRQVK